MWAVLAAASPCCRGCRLVRDRRATAARARARPRRSRRPEPPRTASRRPRRRARITRSRTAWALACFFGLQATAAYITMGWMPQIFRDAGVSAGTAGLLLAVTMVMGVPLAFVIPRLATRLRTRARSPSPSASAA